MEATIKQPLYITNDMLAPKGKRFANYLIDSIVFQYAFFILLGLAGAGLYYAFGYEDLLVWFDEIDRLEELIYTYLLLFVYYNFMEALTGRTLGKYITGTMVVQHDGTRPDAGTIGVRSLCRIIPFDGLSFLGDGRGWHDSLSKTYVVDVKKYKEALRLKNAFDEIGQTEI